MSQGEQRTPTQSPQPLVVDGPIGLDGLVYGIDLLDALLVLHLGDAHLYASWVRPACGVRADEVVTTLRDAYRVAQFTARRLNGAGPLRADVPSPVLTIEMPQRLAILRRVRAYAVAAIFDSAMPLGMARLLSGRLSSALEPELPLTPEAVEAPRPRPLVQVPGPAGAVGGVGGVAGIPGAASSVAGGTAIPPPLVRHTEDSDRAPPTLSFESGLPRRSRPPRPRTPEADRVSRLVAYLEAHAPEPHVVKVRLALRAGLTLRALEDPEAVGPEAMVLIETAVQDILGVDRAELRRIA